MGGRIFVVSWILSSTICLAQFFFYLTELYTERRQKSFLDWVLTRKLTHADIQAADLDDDNVVSAAEFVIMKLKEMEKITAEDVTMLMECFRNLDADDSRTLTAADIVNTE
ncbi:two-pore potassium channel 1-like [Spinacia oleracea]|uniref:Two-pore potassium channel 1-like n=1 Tax=Spinacia oleracea TaxID=3562 RepID=A0ABM3RJ80_SPIOL|nr:two-pore potassium channel 1-like [Spinacia oleracea]